MATQKVPDLKALEDELIARVAAQQSFASWIDYRQQGALVPAKHHKLIIEKLGKIGDLDQWQMLSEFSLEHHGIAWGQHGAFLALA